MTVIDKISFRFGTADEPFTRSLYAGWDGFCRRCVTDILEKFFSSHDKKDTYIEIELLDLDLGCIPQERFYDEFPVRLREALERSFLRHLNETGVLRAPPLDNPETARAEQDALGRAKSSSYSREKRFGNLRHYLEYGFCLPEWDAPDFDIYEELLFFKDKEHAEQLLSLLAFKPYIIGRLFLQLSVERLAEIISLSAWLSSPALGQYEKKRYLAAVLEHTPQSVIRFIHETKDIGGIDGMAELLESPHVKRIMAAETEHHAEIDVPEYWHWLYDWMLEYYPFNGVAMFGDKRHFRVHLNRRLLSFIRKRNSPAYLSKAELTVQFLLEVFGADYYLTVLDIIYHNQRLNADGSPAAGNSFAWELYRMLLRLSLIRIDQTDCKNTDKRPADEKSGDSSAYTTVSVTLSEHIGSFGKWMEDAKLADGVKRISLLRLAKENPELLVQWLRSRPEKHYLSLLATLINQPAVLLLTGAVSMQLTETTAALFDTIDKVSAAVSWLKGIGSNKLTTALNVVILNGIGTGVFSASDSVATQVLRIAGLLYREITETDTPVAANVSGIYSNTAEGQKASEPAFAGDSAAPAAIRELIGIIAVQTPSLPIDNRIYGITSRKNRSGEDTPAVETVSSLKIILSDNRISDSAKKMLMLQWFDTYHGNESELISVLRSDGLLETVIDLLGDSALRHIVMQLAGKVFSTNGLRAETSTVRFTGLLADHIEAVARLISRPTKDIWLLLISSLASWGNSPAAISAANSVDSAIRLLAVIVGTNYIETVAALFIERLSRFSYIEEPKGENSDTGRFGWGSENDALWPLLIRIQKHLPSWESSNRDLIAARTAFEEHLNDIAGIIEWLQSKTFTSAQKREVFRYYMAARPKEAMRLVRETIASKKSTVTLWAEIADREGHYVLTGNKEYPAADSEKWETAERQVIYTLSAMNSTADNNIGICTVAGNDISLLTDRSDSCSKKAFKYLTSRLISPSISDTAKSQQLRQYARWQPKLLWEFIRYSASDNTGGDRIPLRQWSEWLGTEVWLEMISGVSLSLGETLRQVTGVVSEKYPKSVLAQGLVRFIVGCPAERIYYGDMSSITREYISALAPLAWKEDTSASVRGNAVPRIVETGGSEFREQPLASDISDKDRDRYSEALVKEVETVLHTAAEQSLIAAAQPEYIDIPNAGLSLLAPWIPRLFDLLGLLTKDRRDLKDTEARIRAIFILQRLVTDEFREYKEQELAFNRLLTGCPFYVPLPKALELTDNEIRMAETMLTGVKANWGKLKNTSVKGFRHSFIERPGRFEQLDESWMLHVEERAYDILLDSLPWSYSPVRMPWIEKRIKVRWRNKDNFDF